MSSIKLKDSGIAWIGKIPQHWEVIALKYCAQTNTGLSYKPKNITSSEKGIAVLRANNVQNGKIVYDNFVYVESQIITNKKMACAGDLLVCVNNGSTHLLGKTAKITKDGMAFGAFMSIIRSQINDFLYYILQTNMLRHSISDFAVSVGIGQISKSDIDNFKIPLPPLHEQEAIAKFLDEKCQDIDALIATHQESIEKLRDYRTSLISEVIVGQHQGAYQ